MHSLLSPQSFHAVCYLGAPQISLSGSGKLVRYNVPYVFYFLFFYTCLFACLPPKDVQLATVNNGIIEPN